MNRYRFKYLVGRWFTWHEWRYQFKYRLAGMFHRAWYGWAAKDTWSFDGYLATVIAGGLHHLADNNCGCPGHFVEKYGETNGRCFLEWNAWLRRTAYWFEEYADDFGPDWLDLERRAYFHNVILPEFCENFSALWD